MLFEELICIVFYQSYTIHYELTLKNKIYVYQDPSHELFI